MSYQAIYDAVRSRIHGFDSSQLIDQIARQFDISSEKERIQDQVMSILEDHRQPSILYRPSLSRDGDQWCALYGNDLQCSVAGFGKSPGKAMHDFDKNWYKTIPEQEEKDGE